MNSGRYRKFSWLMILCLIAGMLSVQPGVYAEEGVKYSHRDDFNSFDSSFWTVIDKDGSAMDKVGVTNGILRLSATETDNYPTLISKGIPISMGDQLVITRRTYAHPEHDKFAPGMYVTEEVDNSWNTDRNRQNHILWMFQHLYFNYDVGRYPESTVKGNIGYARLDGFTKVNLVAEANYGITRSTLDEWVDETFIYDTVTGDVSITSGGETMSFEGRPLEYDFVRFQMNPGGWYTGQYDEMDWIEFKVVGPGADSLIEDNTGADVVNPSTTGQVYYVREDFEGSSLNSDFWYVYDNNGEAYSRVTVANGELTLPCDQVDNPPILMSKGIPIRSGDIFKIKRRTFAHAASDTYRPWAAVQEVVTDAFTTNSADALGLFSFQHLNFTYDPGRYPGGVTQTNLGLYAAPGQTLSTLPASQYGTTPLTLDKWVEEEFVYNTATGQVTITSDGNTMTFTSKTLDEFFVRYLMNPYGWGTGHYDKLDWIEFIVERPGTATNVPTSGQGVLEGTVLSYDGEVPVAGVTVNLTQNGQVLTSAQTNAEGSYSITAAPGTYDLSLSKTGFIGANYSNVESTAGVTTYIETIMQVPAGTANGAISGYVVNAVTGEFMPGVTLELRQGLNAQSGAVVATLTTDEDGNYGYKGTPGYYTLTAKKDGFVPKVFSASMMSSKENVLSDVAISPKLEAGQVRIVLRWNMTPADIDAHLSGSFANGGTGHIYYSEKTYSSDVCSMQLDVDDRDGGGPETITLARTSNGVYTYLVHDYTNKESSDSRALGESNATVEVYIGDGAAKVFNVPNQPGTLWKVFTYDGTTIKPVNTMSYESTAANIH